MLCIQAQHEVSRTVSQVKKSVVHRRDNGGIPAQDSKFAMSAPFSWGTDFSIGAGAVVLSFLTIGTLLLAGNTFFVARANFAIGLCVADFVEAAAAAAAAATGGCVVLFWGPLR